MPYMSDTVICFDLDDTLYKEIDYLKSAYEEIAEKIGHLEAVPQMIGWYHEGKNVFAELIVKYRLKLTVNDCITIYRNHYPTISLERGVVEFLVEAKKTGCIVGLITDGRSVSQRNKISALGLKGIFDIEVISEEFGSEKPDERNYRVVMERYLGCKRFIYVGDNPKKDFLAPNHLGWETVCLMDNGSNIHQQDFGLTEEYLPKRMIHRISEL